MAASTRQSPHPEESFMSASSPTFSFVLLYVANPPASAAFYSSLLGAPIVEQAPTFAMLPLRDGVMLGLWSKDSVTPAVASAPGASEIALTVDTADAVRATHADWSRRGISIAQTPITLDFGTTFVALDADNHRIRVFAPEAA
jgi:catechol 2,3-dioxygenase-like lactoylglutathione lyase family enzyme